MSAFRRDSYVTEARQAQDFAASKLPEPCSVNRQTAFEVISDSGQHHSQVGSGSLRSVSCSYQVRLDGIVFMGALFVRRHLLLQGAAQAARPASAGTVAAW